MPKLIIHEFLKYWKPDFDHKSKSKLILFVTAVTNKINDICKYHHNILISTRVILGLSLNNIK